MAQHSENKTGENKMGTMEVNKLVIQVALPIIVSMTIQGLYNVVDSIFVAKINEDALNAVSLAFPVQNTMIAVAVGLSVGMNAVLSRSLGQKKQDKVTDTAMNGLFLTAIASVLSLLFGVFAVKSFYASQTDIASILAYGEEYLLLCCVFGFPLFFSITLERTLQATGRTMCTMTSQAVGALTNIILDPIFIFGYFGFPRMEVKGAAYATVIGYFISFFLNIYFNWKHNPDLQFKFRGFRPQWSIIKEIFAVAIPSMAMGSAGSVLVYYLNQILLDITATATAVLGVYYKLQSFVYMPVYGLTNGMIPILGYNYGARNYQRFIKALFYGLVYGIGIMTLGMIVFQLFPDPLFRLFAEEGGEMESMGVSALKIISFAYPIAAVSVVLSCLFQALGHGITSLMVCVIRYLLVQLPCAYILSLQYSVTGVWYSFIVAEIAALLYSMFCFYKSYQKDILPMQLHQGENEG